MASLSFGASIKWAPSLDQAISEANKTNKGIMVFIEAENCPYCEKMKKEVLSKPYMAHALEKFVSVKLDIANKDAKKNFPGTYVTPTIYFVTPKMKILDQITGAVDEEFFFWHVDAAEQALK